MAQQLTGAQALTQALLKTGATRLYGIIGTSNVAFVDARDFLIEYRTGGTPDQPLASKTSPARRSQEALAT